MSKLLLNRRQDVAELRVVHFDAVVEITRDFLIRQVMNLFFVLPYFFRPFKQRFALLIEIAKRFGVRRRFDLRVQFADFAMVDLLKTEDVVSPDTRQKIGRVSVHIDQAFETVLLAGIEEPVDWTLLVNLDVIRVKAVEEIVAYDVARRAATAKRVRDKLEILF